MEEVTRQSPDYCRRAELLHGYEATYRLFLLCGRSTPSEISRFDCIGGALIDRDCLISEIVNLANLPPDIAKNENYKNINFIRITQL
jgi:hypothetical protein